MELEHQPSDLTIQEQDDANLLELYKDLEFKGWVAELSASTDSSNSESPGTSTAIEQQYDCITTEEAFANWLQQLQTCDAFAFDTETTSLNYMQAELVGVSFSIEPGRAAYVPVAHDYPGAPDQLERDWVLQQLQPLLEAEQPKKIGQNLKYDKSVLAQYDIELKGPTAIILGAEGRGIRRLTRDHCDQVVHIPMQGSAESLNVSVAAGVCLFEAARQRGL